MRARTQLLAFVSLLAAWFAYENVRSPTVLQQRAAAERDADDVTAQGSQQYLSKPFTRAVSAATTAFAAPASARNFEAPKPFVETANTASSSDITALPPPPPPPCNDLNCAARFGEDEPSWAQLAFQPRINWAAGGVRGDCVAGELEYIMPKYCSPDPTFDERHGVGRWPSEKRLRSIDVHAQSLPQADFSEIVRLLPNRTLLLMGDSVMEQFYNTLQCYLRKEALELPNTDEFLAFVASAAPLWRMGKRKKPPKLPQQARGGMRMMYSRVTTILPDEVKAAIGTADVIVVNWGLHYQKMNQYQQDLAEAFKVLDEYAQQPGKAVIFQETGAQHFKSSDPRGFSTGEWENRDKGTDGQCTCKAIEDFNVNTRNQVLRQVLDTGAYPNVRLLPFYGLTRPRWRWHFGNCTHRPNGWNYETCCDCTHFCYSPSMWHAHLYNLKKELLRTALAARPR